jgi:hypothetical protein
MTQKTFTIIASVIFGVVALLYVLRIFFGLAGRNRRLDGTDVVKLDRSRRRRRLGLLRNKPRHAWLTQRKQTALRRSGRAGIHRREWNVPFGHSRTNHRGPKSTFVRYCPKADKRGCG